jgi:Uma2 family endonuclease
MDKHTVVAKTRMTPEDLWRLGDDDVRRELVNGEVIEMTPAGGLHGETVARITLPLMEYIREHRIGRVVTGDVGFVLALPDDPHRVRAPDAAFIASARLPGRMPVTFVPGPPDLAIEVLSPSDNPVDVQQKVRDYLEAGTRLVWIVAPQANSVTVYRPDGSARLVCSPEALDGEEVMPGLTISLAELFADDRSDAPDR